MDEVSDVKKREHTSYFLLENTCVSFLFIFPNVSILIKYSNHTIYLRYKLADFLSRFDKLKMNFTQTCYTDISAY